MNDHKETTSTLEVDGKTWRLTYDFNAIADAERIAECNLLAALDNLAAISAAQLRGLLYAAIVVADARLRPTLQEVGALIRIDTLAAITEALAEAYRLSMPEPASADTASAGG